MPQDDARRPRRVDTHRQGAIDLEVYEYRGRSYWRLMRDTAAGPVEVATGFGGEVRDVAKAFRKAERSLGPDRTPERAPDRPGLWSRLRSAVAAFIAPARPAREEGPWYAVVRLSGLTEAGAEGRVVAGFDDLKYARQYRDRNHGLALYPGALVERPWPGDRVEVTDREFEGLARRGEGSDLALQFERLRWQAEQGRHFGHGLWNDREAAPLAGDLVRFTSGLDYRGRPVGRLVEPMHGREPGPGGSPLHVAFERHPSRPGVGRVLGVAATVDQVERIAATAERAYREREQVLRQADWKSLEFGRELREVAFRPVPESHPLKLRTHFVGSDRVDVIDRPGEDGRRQRTFIVTREARTPNGLLRSDSTVVEASTLRTLIEVARSRSARRDEPGRDGPKPAPGRSQQSAATTRDADPQSLPGRNAASRDTTVLQPRPVGLDAARAPERVVGPAVARPSPPVPKVGRGGDGTPGPGGTKGPLEHVVIGRWHGAEPPRPGMFVAYPRDHDGPDGCPMMPWGGQPASGPPAKSEYVIARILGGNFPLGGQGTGAVIESVRGLKQAEARAMALDGQEQRQQHRDAPAKSPSPEPTLPPPMPPMRP